MQLVWGVARAVRIFKAPQGFQRVARGENCGLKKSGSLTEGTEPHTVPGV